MSRATEKVTFEIYKDVDRQWRWRLLRKAFGRVFIVADSAEAYINRKDCSSAMCHIIKAIKAACCATLTICLAMLVTSCDTLPNQAFRAEQTSVNLAYASYGQYTNWLLTSLANTNISSDRRAYLVGVSNEVKQARLKFAATVATAEEMRTSYMTNSALKKPLEAALTTLYDSGSNICWLLNYWRTQ